MAVVLKSGSGKKEHKRKRRSSKMRITLPLPTHHSPTPLELAATVGGHERERILPKLKVQEVALHRIKNVQAAGLEDGVRGRRRTSRRHPETDMEHILGVTFLEKTVTLLTLLGIVGAILVWKGLADVSVHLQVLYENERDGTCDIPKWYGEGEQARSQCYRRFGCRTKGLLRSHCEQQPELTGGVAAFYHTAQALGVVSLLMVCFILRSRFYRPWKKAVLLMVPPVLQLFTCVVNAIIVVWLLGIRWEVFSEVQLMEKEPTFMYEEALVVSEEEVDKDFYAPCYPDQIGPWDEQTCSKVGAAMTIMEAGALMTGIVMAMACVTTYWGLRKIEKYPLENDHVQRLQLPTAA